jgi:hypothetical protein
VTESLDIYKLGRYCYWREDDPIRQLVLYEKNFGLMVVWELNPEVLGWLWLMTTATSGGDYFG